MNKTQKIEVLSNLTQQLANSKSSTVVDYKGMTMTDLQTLRSALAPVGGTFTVVKNTLLRLALEKGGNKPNESLLEGQTALISATEDEIAPLQALAKYLKTKELPALKFGVFEGKLIDKLTLTALSKLPGKQTLYAQLVGSLAGPAYALVGTLSGGMQQLVGVLDQRQKQLSQ